MAVRIKNIFNATYFLILLSCWSTFDLLFRSVSKVSTCLPLMVYPHCTRKGPVTVQGPKAKYSVM